MIFTKEKLTTAIDISDGFLKILATSLDKSGRKLHVLASVQLPNVGDREVAKEIRTFISKYKLGKSVFIVSFPRHLVTIRDLRLPATEEQEVRNMAELQAMKYLPYSKEEMVIDYKMIGITKEGYGHILLILAQRKSVGRYMDIFRYAGVSIDRIALSSEGISNWYSMLGIDDSRPIAVVDVDRYHTHIQVMKNKNLLFSRSVSFNTVDLNTDKNILLKETRLSLDSYLKESKEDISGMIASGSEEHSKEISTFLADNFSLPCENIEQLRCVKSKRETDRFSEQLAKASYTSLLGFTLSPEKLKVNLIPRDIITKKKEQAVKNELMKTIVLFLCITVAVLAIMETKMSREREQLNKIETRLREIDPEVKKLSRLKEDVELIQNQLTLKGSSIDIIRQLYEILPSDISLTLFEFEDKYRISLRGTSTELSSVFKLLPVLEESSYFENVRINYANKRTFKHKEFADFEIVCALTDIYKIAEK